tara:strand:+ start:2636 stop:3283 length:648 start_codon:yes stop_codon:yes gene_type:complete
MEEKIIETNYDVTKKSKLSKFYESNKILIFLTIFLLVICVSFVTYYSESKKKDKVEMSNNYISAKIYIQNDKKNEATKILKSIILSNDKTYSTLSLFLILNENLIDDKKEIINLFDHLLENNKFEKEVKNLIIFKKIILQSNYVDESELLQLIKPLITTDTLWKPHALLLLGDFFVFKKEYLKAKEFYLQVLSLKDLNKEMYENAKLQLSLISNE